MSCGVEKMQIGFIFCDKRLNNEKMLENINDIIHSGEISNIYNEKDTGEINNQCRHECIKLNLKVT